MLPRPLSLCDLSLFQCASNRNRLFVMSQRTIMGVKGRQSWGGGLQRALQGKRLLLLFKKQLFLAKCNQTRNSRFNGRSKVFLHLLIIIDHPLIRPPPQKTIQTHKQRDYIPIPKPIKPEYLNSIYTSVPNSIFLVGFGYFGSRSHRVLYVLYGSRPRT